MLSVEVRDELAADLAQAERSRVAIDSVDRPAIPISTWSTPTRSS